MIHITTPEHIKDLSLLLIRLLVGFSFVVAARNKNRDIKSFAKKNGLPMPLAVIVMYAEFICGAALALGILAQFAAIAIMLLMLGTTRVHIFKWKSSYWAQTGGWEYDLMLFAMALVVLAYGPGRFALLK